MSPVAVKAKSSMVEQKASSLLADQLKSMVKDVPRTSWETEEEFRFAGYQNAWRDSLMKWMGCLVKLVKSCHVHLGDASCSVHAISYMLGAMSNFMDAFIVAIMAPGDVKDSDLFREFVRYAQETLNDVAESYNLSDFDNLVHRSFRSYANGRREIQQFMKYLSMCTPFTFDQHNIREEIYLKYLEIDIIIDIQKSLSWQPRASLHDFPSAAAIVLLESLRERMRESENDCESDAADREDLRGDQTRAVSDEEPQDSQKSFTWDSIESDNIDGTASTSSEVNSSDGDSSEDATQDYSRDHTGSDMSETGTYLEDNRKSDEDIDVYCADEEMSEGSTSLTSHYMMLLGDVLRAMPRRR